MKKQLVAAISMVSFMLLNSLVQGQEIQKSTDSKKNASITGLKKTYNTFYTVDEVMIKYGLKGLSVAVFENYKLSWTETWGSERCCKQR